jgi:hypothetical protein
MNARWPVTRHRWPTADWPRCCRLVQLGRVVIVIVVIVVGLGRGVGALHGDRDLNVAPEFLGQCRGDEGTQPVLEVVLHPLVGGGDQGGVLDETEGPGLAQPGSLIGADRVVETTDCGGPDSREIGAVVHEPCSTFRRSCGPMPCVAWRCPPDPAGRFAWRNGTGARQSTDLYTTCERFERWLVGVLISPPAELNSGHLLPTSGRGVSGRGSESPPVRLIDRPCGPSRRLG